MPGGLDQSAILEALQRRGGGQGGAGIPLIQQRSAAGGVTPVGGANVPTQTPTGVQRTPSPSALPAQQAGAKVGQAAQSPQFDDQTRALGKALVKKLLDVM